MTRRTLLPLLLVVASVAAGCSGSNDELRQWMADTRKEMRPVTATLAELLHGAIRTQGIAQRV